jgi:hypothetical protein
MKNEIEKLTDMMVDGIEKAIITSQELGMGHGIRAAFNAHMILLVLLQALKDQNEQHLMGKVVEFVDEVQKASSEGANNAVKDLIDGLDGINLN